MASVERGLSRLAILPSYLSPFETSSSSKGRTRKAEGIEVIEVVVHLAGCGWLEMNNDAHKLAHQRAIIAYLTSGREGVSP
jgi:hypothetical protein